MKIYLSMYLDFLSDLCDFDLVGLPLVCGVQARVQASTAQPVLCTPQVQQLNTFFLLHMYSI